MKKKVLQFIHGFSMGGAETLVKEYCLKLNKENYEVAVLCFYQYHSPYEQQLEDAGIRITYIHDISDYYSRNKLQLYMQRISFVKNYIKREVPDVIHTHLNNNLYIWLAKPKKGTKIFHSVHSEPKELWDSSVESRIDFFAAKRLIKQYGMRFITLHEEMRKEINALFQVRDSLILNNGIDFSRYEKALDREQVRSRENIPQDAFVLGHIGRFTENKNQGFIVDIFYEICKEMPNTYLLLIGIGETEQEIKEKIKEKSLEDRCRILSYRSDIPDLLRAMDCFVFPSKYEGLGIALIEAQKMQLPCVVSSTVPKAAQISNLIKWMDLEQPAKAWADAIETFRVETIQYHGLEAWDMNQVIRQLEAFYES